MSVSRRALLPLVLIIGFAQPAAAQTSLSLAAHVREARAASSAPALGVVVVRCSGSPEIAVEGEARTDRPSSVSTEGRFNIGSNAKSMLATLAATYVAEDVLRWDTEVGAVLVAEAESMDPSLRHATLAQLLSHRSGLPAYSSGTELSALRPAGPTAQAQRLNVALTALRGPAAYAPGSQTVYSNAGYIVVGAMLERISGQPFEILMLRRLFEPLGMQGATFGDSSPDTVGQPVGHISREGVQAVYLDSEPAIPAFLQPAGDVSLPLSDYGLYLQEHLCGLEDKPTRLLSPDILRRMHEPQGDEGVSMGWGRYAFGEAPASIHVGGTGAFSAFVAVLPSEDLAVATVVNSGYDGARQAALGLLQSVIQARLSHTDAPD